MPPDFLRKGTEWFPLWLIVTASVIAALSHENTTQELCSLALLTSCAQLRLALY